MNCQYAGEKGLQKDGNGEGSLKTQKDRGLRSGKGEISDYGYGGLKLTTTKVVQWAQERDVGNRVRDCWVN